MNLQQLDYIIAVDTHRHFARAAEKSFVTQPTLSMMIQKLEEELGIRIFDRSQQPVVPTQEGEEIIVRARQIMADVGLLKEFTQELRHEVSGELKLAVIPTLAPYLLPLFLKSFVEKHPLLKTTIRELVTNDIIAALKNGDIDIGLLATPLNDPRLEEHPVFYEEFFAYAAAEEKVSRKKFLLPKDIDLSKLWLLEEGHCLRNQVFNLCELKKKDFESDRLHYEAGSLDLTKKQRAKIREFAPPKPVREVSLVVNKNFHRTRLLQALRTEIENQLPVSIGKMQEKRVMEI